MENRGLDLVDIEGVFGQGSPTRVALYARVSTHDQQTLPLQLAAMETYARHRHWRIVARVEEIASGVKHRPLREELLAQARRRTIDAVLVWRLDRWSRSVIDLLNSLQELQAVGVGFVSITEALDLTTPAGRAMAGLLAVFAELEHSILRDRVCAGIAEARRRGTPHGRPATARAFLAEVQKRLSAGDSKRRIAAELGISRSSVRRMALSSVA